MGAFPGRDTRCTEMGVSPGETGGARKAEYHIQVAIIQTQNDSCMSKYRIYGS